MFALAVGVLAVWGVVLADPVIEFALGGSHHSAPTATTVGGGQHGDAMGQHRDAMGQHGAMASKHGSG